MNFSEKTTFLKELNSDIIFYSGLDDALVGYCDIFNKTIALYDKEKAVNILVTKNNWSEEDALEFFNYNIIDSYLGEFTPGFITYL